MKARPQIQMVAAVLACAVLSPGLSGAHGSMDMSMSDMVMVSRASYTVPDVALVRQDGTAVSLPAEMNDGRPVILNFMYTSCTDICPMLTQTLSIVQHRLVKAGQKVHFISISIDPEADTPAKLTEYAHTFHAGPDWQFYTGTLGASLKVQTAFDVYRGDKMSHTAVTLMRAAPGKPWERIEGLVTADQLLHDFHQLSSAQYAAK